MDRVRGVAWFPDLATRGLPSVLREHIVRTLRVSTIGAEIGLTGNHGVHP